MVDVARRKPGRAKSVLDGIPELAGPEGADADVPPSSDEDEFMCGDCGRSFRTSAACKLHRAKVHDEGHAARIRAVVVNSTCPGCFVDFRSWLRVVHHLSQGKSGCRTAF